ncbi:alpha/beta fold hydrolase [Streptomyces sp. NPDC098781]|uniref:alpha/beta fold hydrolase n=1 Tax=Streptomyces sp. NPDC098781 TaxID=3366097 RepID=UPI0037F2AA18
MLVRTAAAVAGITAVTASLIVANGASAEEASTPTPRIAWKDCNEPIFQGMDCGTMRVPIDPSRPSTGTTQLALVRRPADNQAERIGTMLMNNGPGSSSIEQLRYAMIGQLDKLGGSFTKRFDLLAVDPRGVGHSSPLRCDVPLKGRGITHFPATEAEFNALKAHNKALAANCREKNGPLADHVDMASTARDFEYVRRALGEKQLHWYGITYSNLLGRTYAKLYPGRLRSMVLDTATNDGLPPVERMADEMRAAEDSFNRFAKWCGTSESCALNGQDVAAVYDQLVKKANAEPIPIGTTGRFMNGEDIQTATQGHLVMKLVTWGPFGKALKQAIDGDASLLSVDPDKTLDWTQAQIQACQDMPPAATNWRQYANLKTMADEISPHLGGAVQSWTYMAGCLGWPGAAKHSPASGPVNGAPPALILQSTHESLAAYNSGFGLAAQLPGSQVLTNVGDDYTMYMISPCVLENVDRYLADGTMPAPRATCATPS